MSRYTSSYPEIVSRPARRRLAVLPRSAFVWAASLVLLISAHGLLADGDPTPDFSGTWQLNEELSDNPVEKMREARGGGGGGGGRGGGGFGGGGGRGGGGGGFGGGGGGGRGGGGGQGSGSGNAERFQAQQEAIATLTVDHQDPALVVRDASDREETLYSDERVFDRNGPRGRTYEASGKWKRNSLRFETVESNYGPDSTDEEEAAQAQANSWGRQARGQGGSVEVTETWKLSDDGEQLTIVTKTQRGGQGQGGGRGGGRSLELKRVYDRVDPAAASEDADTGLPGTPVSQGTEVPVLAAPEEGGGTSASWYRPGT